MVEAIVTRGQFSTFAKPRVGGPRPRVNVELTCRFLDREVVMTGPALETLLNLKFDPRIPFWLSDRVTGNQRFPEFLRAAGVPLSKTLSVLQGLSNLNEDDLLPSPILVRIRGGSPWQPPSGQPVVTAPFGDHNTFPFMNVPAAELGATFIAPLDMVIVKDGTRWRAGSRAFVTVEKGKMLVFHHAEHPVLWDGSFHGVELLPNHPQVTTPRIDEFLDDKEAAFRTLGEKVPFPSQVTILLPTGNTDPVEQFRQVQSQLAEARASLGNDIVIKPITGRGGGNVIFSCHFSNFIEFSEAVAAVMSVEQTAVVASKEVVTPERYLIPHDGQPHDWILRVFVTPKEQSSADKQKATFQTAGIVCCHQVARRKAINLSLVAEPMSLETLCTRLNLDQRERENWMQQIDRIAATAGQAVQNQYPHERVTLLGLDIKLDSNGTFKVLEVNGSNSGGIAATWKGLEPPERLIFLRRLLTGVMLQRDSAPRSSAELATQGSPTFHHPATILLSLFNSTTGYGAYLRESLTERVKVYTGDLASQFHATSQLFIFEALIGNFANAEVAFRRLAATFQTQAEGKNLIHQISVILPTLKLIGLGRQAIYLERKHTEYISLTRGEPAAVRPQHEFFTVVAPVFQECLEHSQEGGKKWVRRLRALLRYGEELVIRAKNLPPSSETVPVSALRSRLFEMLLEYLLRKNLLDDIVEKIKVFPQITQTGSLGPRGATLLAYLLIRVGEYQKVLDILTRPDLPFILDKHPVVGLLYAIASQAAGEKESSGELARIAIKQMEHSVPGISITRLMVKQEQVE